MMRERKKIPLVLLFQTVLDIHQEMGKARNGEQTRSKAEAWEE